MSERKVRVIQTSQGSTDRLTEKEAIVLRDDARGIENQLINVYDDVRYQEIIGFGGAITEASAVTAYKLGEENRNRILEAYFDADNGIGYNVVRTHISSCDFSLGNYDYVQDGDEKLETFDISRDREKIIPYIQGARKLVGKDFTFYA
ncbi:MAG: glucosylceramidase, partial [Cohnella sp.]|nr:glucosylceramidase [Cohnella sp.]